MEKIIAALDALRELGDRIAQIQVFSKADKQRVSLINGHGKCMGLSLSKLLDESLKTRPSIQNRAQSSYRKSVYWL